MAGMDISANILVGKALAGARGRTGLTQVQLAARLGVPQSFVSKVESGERSVHVYELFRYTEALEVDVHELVDEIQAALGH